MGENEKKTEENTVEENKTEEKKERKEKKRKRTSKGLQKFLYLLQHVCIALMVVSVLVVTTGSSVVVHGLSWQQRYTIPSSNQGSVYEDSELFDMIYGRSVADIMRYSVIRSQMETDGVFDGKKVIDVTAYNYRNSELPEQYITVRYYLEDLLKWYQYGVETNTVSMDEEMLKEFLGDFTSVTVVDKNSRYYNTSDAGYLKSDIGNYTFTQDVSGNLLAEGMDGTPWEGLRAGEVATVDTMVNRYKTVDGKNIEEYVSDWNSYLALCSSVQSAMENLNYNYQEYLDYNDYYAANNTNIRYLVERTVGNHTEYYTNMDEAEAGQVMDAILLLTGNEPAVSSAIDRVAGSVSDSEAVNEATHIETENIYNVQETERLQRESLLNALASENDKYLYFSPSDMIYSSNSNIAEETVRSILRQYDYAYPENVRIWISVDTSYPAADAFTQGKAGFNNYLPYFWQWVSMAVIAGILYLLIVVYLVVNTGRELDKEGNLYIRLSKFDRISTEAGLVSGICVAVLICGILYIVAEGLHFPSDISTLWFRVALGIAVFCMDMAFFTFFYSLVRRIKAKTLWSNSWTKRLVHKLSKLIWEVYDNGNIVVRTWVPYLIFLIFNLLMVLTIDITIFGVMAAFIIDMVFGGLLYHDVKERQDIVKGIERISEGDFSYQIEQSAMHGDNLTLAKAVNNIRNAIKNAVEISMKDERMKADLITNVSHDIKTPLTSIINYVDLLKREEIDNERIRGYIKVLDEKSQRLKQLTDDLVEASKISSGNINLQFERIDLVELLNQTVGEFSEKFKEKCLSVIVNVNATNTVIEADSRRIWRVMENLFSNVYKYALEGTRVYVAVDSRKSPDGQDSVEISIKNISAMELNCNPEELTERFIRGDESRTTEGSGLGLSIAKNLTQAQNGSFEIQLDGDLFKVVMVFPIFK